MKEPHTHIVDLLEVDVPTDGILSRTVYEDEHLKAVLFAFSGGQELSEHTASVPAAIQILSGTARIRLGDATHEARAGTWIHMAARLPHAIRAESPMTMLLLMRKGAT